MPVYCRYSFRLRKYIAFQIVKKLGEKPHPERFGIVFLDWTGNSAISEKEFANARPWGGVDYFESPVPRGFIHVFDAPACKVKQPRFCGLAMWYNWDRMFVFKKLFGHLPDARRGKIRQVENENGSLDLRGSESSAVIRNSRIDEIIIDGEIDSIQIEASAVVEKISDSSQGEKLRLTLSTKKILYPGLEKLKDLTIDDAEEINLNDVTEFYPTLQTLSIHGKPGSIAGFDALRKLPNLEVFWCFNMCGFDGSDMPGPDELPNLFHLWFEDLPNDAAKRIRKTWKDADGVIVNIGKARKPEWFAENRDNPFHDWDERDGIPKAFAKKAFSLYKTCKTQMLALSSLPEAERPAAFAEAVRGFVAAFNVMDEKEPFIETIEREEIYEAALDLWRLAQKQCGLGMTEDEFIDTFDNRRDW